MSEVKHVLAHDINGTDHAGAPCDCEAYVEATSYDTLTARLAQAERERDAAEQRAEKAEKESAQASTTIKSLCDRIDRICSIAHDRNMHPSARLEQIREWSEGFMPIPDATLASTPRDEVETTAAGSTGEESRRDYQTPVLANNPAGSFARTKTYGGKP